MKKLFLTVVLMSFVVSLGAFALADTSQGINATIEPVINVIIDPLPTLSFGSVLQGTTGNAATNGPVSFSGGVGANTDMSIIVTSVTGTPFAAGLKFDGEDPTTLSFNLICDSSGGACVYTTQTTIPTLNVPAGFPASSPTGVINYLITGSPPS